MPRARRVLVWSLVAALAAPVLATDPPTPPPMSPEQQAALQAILKAMAPGPEHQSLAAGVGSWTFKGRFWDARDAAPTESSGTAERTMLLGGRVEMEKLTSEFMGMPFEGLGLTGFDNVTGKYWSTWIDNMSTGVMLSTGSCDLAAGICRFDGSYSDPVSGKVKAIRMEMRRVSPDEEVARSYETGPDGGERLTMEMTYTRRKG